MKLLKKDVKQSIRWLRRILQASEPNSDVTFRVELEITRQEYYELEKLRRRLNMGSNQED
jgi:hypothetical protein